MKQQTMPSDEELMVKVATKNDRQAFEMLYNRHARKMMGFFLHMFGTDARMSVEDCVQEVFFRVYRERTSYRTDASFPTWLYTIAYNLCKNEFRHRAVVNAYKEDCYMRKEEEMTLHDEGQRYDGIAFEKRLRQCLAKLQSEQRAAFMLRYYEEMPVAEIARIQSCPEGTVKSRLHAAVTYLSEQLKEYV